MNSFLVLAVNIILFHSLCISPFSSSLMTSHPIQRQVSQNLLGLKFMRNSSLSRSQSTISVEYIPAHPQELLPADLSEAAVSRWSLVQQQRPLK